MMQWVEQKLLRVLTVEQLVEQTFAPILRDPKLQPSVEPLIWTLVVLPAFEHQR